jgi:hypothetical protein
MKYLLIGDYNATMFKDLDPNTVCFETNTLLDTEHDSEELRTFLRENAGPDSVIITSINNYHHTCSWKELGSWRDLDIENYSQDTARKVYAKLANWYNVYGFFSVILHGSVPGNIRQYPNLGDLARAGDAPTRNKIIHSFNRAFIHWAETDSSPVYFASNFYTLIDVKTMLGSVIVTEITHNYYAKPMIDWIWEYQIIPCSQHHEKVRIARRFYSELQDANYQVTVQWTSRGIQYGSWTYDGHCLADKSQSVELLNETWSWQESTNANAEVFQELYLSDR